MRFISDKYNFTDSIIDKIELSSNLKDVVIVIDCFIGKDASSTKKITLVNVKDLTMHIEQAANNDSITPMTIANISVKRGNANCEIVIDSVITFLENTRVIPPILKCSCEEVLIDE